MKNKIAFLFFSLSVTTVHAMDFQLPYPQTESVSQQRLAVYSKEQLDLSIHELSTAIGELRNQLQTPGTLKSGNPNGAPQTEQPGWGTHIWNATGRGLSLVGNGVWHAGRIVGNFMNAPSSYGKGTFQYADGRIVTIYQDRQGNYRTMDGNLL